MRFIDSIHRFDLFVRFVDSIRSLDRSMVLHHVVNTYRLNKSARRNTPGLVEGETACRIGELSVTEPKVSKICGLILYFFVLIGPLKPEVEEEVAEHQFCCSLVHFSPPLFSPQEANAVRRATSLNPATSFLKRSKF